MITEYSELSKLISIQSCSYTDFCSRIAILDIGDTTGTFAVRSNLTTFLDRVVKKSTDTRKDNLNEYTKKMYDMLVVNGEDCLKEWFNKYVALREDFSWYMSLPAGSCYKNKVFVGSQNSKYGRLARNINFHDFYNTKKLYLNDSEYVLGLMKVMFENFHLRNSLASPAFFDMICKGIDYTKFWNFFMMGSNKASIFNPYTYKSILDELFTGEVLFAPVMGWNTYQQAFYNSQFNHFISTDVIPGVVDNGIWMHQNHNINKLVESNKTVDLYLCPSEKLDDRYNFIQKYENKVDAVLFSPPYFDLEIYPGEEQSITSFPNYRDWLEGYWRETVKLCKAVMKNEARFGFVISDYRNHEKIDKTISSDMMLVAAEELNFLDRYSVKWNARAGSRQAHKTRDGNFETLWLYEKNDG